MFFCKHIENIITFVTMIERIKLLMSVKNLTPAQLANELGVQRSGISHILSGRNKPSLDFVLKIMDSFSDLNESWLLKGDGEILKSSGLIDPSHPQALVPSSNQDKNPIEISDIEVLEVPTNRIEAVEETKEDTEPIESEAPIALKKELDLFHKDPIKELENKVMRADPKLVKWVAFYDDDSFKEFFRQ